MKFRNIICTVAALGTIGMSTVSCTGKFDDYNTDDNATSKVTPAMIATKLILNITDIGGQKYSIFHGLLQKQTVWCEGTSEDNQYNLLSRVGFGDYTDFTNCQKMIMEASSQTEAIQNSYKALAKFIKAYRLYGITMKLGDIPYSDSNAGESGNFTPKYDTQHDVFAHILEDLESAESLFASGAKFEGDPIYDGDPAKWRKACNVFELKVLMNMQQVADQSDAADLNVKSRFARIASSGNIFTGNADNFMLVFSDAAGQQYPLYNNQHMSFYATSSYIIEPLKNLNDYRLFYYCSPAVGKTNAGVAASSWDAYPGLNPTADQSVNNAAHADLMDCKPNQRYLEPAGEPITRIGYMEQNFILAEAALRGWINGSAEEYYKKGIRASMEFIAQYTPAGETYNHGKEITAEYIDQYLAQPNVQLKSNFDGALEQIITQKYLGSYRQSLDYECWFDHRRTGYPAWELNPSTNLNDEQNKFPIRWRYSQDEIDYNKANLEEALNRQYGGNDGFNEKMWIVPNAVETPIAGKIITDFGK